MKPLLYIIAANIHSLNNNNILRLRVNTRTERNTRSRAWSKALEITLGVIVGLLQDGRIQQDCSTTLVNGTGEPASASTYLL